jgi:L-asparagine transporter-like permease
MSDKDQILEIFFKEYDKLKSEQAQRIGFRDNLLYVTLGLFATIISFAVSNSTNYYALLVVPWVCLILALFCHSRQQKTETREFVEIWELPPGSDS